MPDEGQYKILRGLPEPLIGGAAQIYWEAFRQKLKPVLGDDERAIRFFEQSIIPDHVITALSHDEHEIFGLAGFDIGEGGAIGGGFGLLLGIYGLSTFWRLPLLMLFSRAHMDGSLQMDGIAVHPDHRGRGIGSAILNEIITFAREKECRQIALDVIDVNPRARALYERMGFLVTNVQGFGPLSRLFGFSKSYKMIMRLD